MKLRDITRSFLEETWVSLFKAIEKDWILLWMWFVEDELWLAEAMTSNLTYQSLIDKLKAMYIQRMNTTKYSLTRWQVLEAIKISITNSVIWLRWYRTVTRYSEWLLDTNRAINICQKYSNPLNPLIFECIDFNTSLIFKSLFQDRKFWLSYVWLKNWQDSKWAKFRRWPNIAKRWMYHVIWFIDVKKDIYHPIVWHLLENDMLDNYLDDDMKKDIKDFVEKLKPLWTFTVNDNI